jgi:rhodanese-related sulfurtransferase
MGFFSSIPSVSAVKADERLHTGDAVLVDVRSPGEFAAGHARGALNCPLPTLSSCVSKLKKFSEVYVICQSGGRSAMAVSALLAENVHAINVSGGTLAWRAQGLAIA